MTHIAATGSAPTPSFASPAAHPPRYASTPADELAARLNAYFAPAADPDGREGARAVTHRRIRDVAAAHRAIAPDPACAADPTTTAARDGVAGIPMNEDFGVELMRRFRTSGLSSWARADVIEQAFNEWKSVGPSPKAAKRLAKILEPGYVDTPEERKGAVILDALALHLIDRGRYAPLVQDYIDTLRRNGHYDTLVDGMMALSPGRSRTWAEDMLKASFFIWDEPFPAELRGESSAGDTPAFDLDTRLLKLYRLMNPDRHMNEAQASDGDLADTADAADAADEADAADAADTA